MTRNQLLTGLLSVFVAGIVVGVFGARAYVRHAAESSFRGGADATRAMVLHLVGWQLSLSNEQLSQLDEPARRLQKSLIEIRRRNDPEIRQLIEKALAEVEPILNERQRQKVHERYAEVQQRWTNDAEWLRNQQ